MLYFAILFLFSVQLITDFIEGIYAFGLLGTSVPIEIIAILFLFSPLLLLFFRKGISDRALLVLGELLLVCRAVEPYLDMRFRMLISGLGVALFLIVLPALLWKYANSSQSTIARLLGLSLILAISFGLLYKAAYPGYDYTTDSRIGAIMGVVLALLAGFLLPRILYHPIKDHYEPTSPNHQRKTAPLLLCILGLITTWGLFYFAFGSLNVIYRWSSTDSRVITLTIPFGLCWIAICLVNPGFWRLLRPIVLWIWNLGFVLSLALTLLARQVSFPVTPQGYPLSESPVPLWGMAAMWVMLLCYPVILVNFTLFANGIIAHRPSLPHLGASFAFGSLILLVFIIAHISTTVYDYFPVIGPLLRDRYWLVYSLLGGLMFLSALCVSPSPRKRGVWGEITPPVPFIGQVQGESGASLEMKTPISKPSVLNSHSKSTWWILGFILVISSSVRSSIYFIDNNPHPTVVPSEETLSFATYNVQQGYSGGDKPFKNPQRQVEVLRNFDVDFIGLQETDTNRIANGNADLVDYFSNELDMYSYYGPNPVAGTFGIALLSKFRIQNPRTFYMFSTGEQTACIHAQIVIKDRTFNIFVTHLGNGGPIIQQEQVLQEIQGLENIILVGDFNFQTETEQYRITTRMLNDAWLLKWPTGIDDQNFNPLDRIDHVFLSPNFQVQNAQLWAGDESDHPAVFVKISW
jgi:endonuclease/exonuclease/phosphatase family metal-dependent hydrolase